MANLSRLPMPGGDATGTTSRGWALPKLRIRGDGVERDIPLGDDPDGIVIGRSSAQADLCITDGLASRRHCRLFRAAGNTLVEDLGSKHGTLLNGAAITQPTALQHQDELRIGATRLIYVCYLEALLDVRNSTSAPEGESKREPTDAAGASAASSDADEAQPLDAADGVGASALASTGGEQASVLAPDEDAWPAWWPRPTQLLLAAAVTAGTLACVLSYALWRLATLHPVLVP